MHLFQALSHGVTVDGSGELSQLLALMLAGPGFCLVLTVSYFQGKRKEVISALCADPKFFWSPVWLGILQFCS